MRLFLVEAANPDYDEFDSAVVYANDEADAISIVIESVTNSLTLRMQDTPGVWYPLGASALTATPVERRRGPVHGHGHAG